MRSLLRAAMALGLAAGLAGTAGATPITYTESFTASGTLGGTNFTDQTVTLTGVGDTANVANLGGGVFFNLLQSASVSFGATTADLTDATKVFANQTNTAFGFNDKGTEDIVDTTAPAYATYALAGPIGPVVGGLEFLNTSLAFPTTAGPLTFATGSAPVTVTASAVPEPAAMTLMGIGLAALAGSVWRRRRHATA